MPTVAVLVAVIFAWSLSQPHVEADDFQYGTIIVTVQDQAGAPVPHADIVTTIGTTVYSNGTVEHLPADENGQRTFQYPANIQDTRICAEFQYLHGACGPFFVLSPGEIRAFTIVLPFTLSAPPAPTPAPASSAPSPTATPSPAAPASVPVATPLTSPIPSPCPFILGFKAIHDLLPAAIGACLDSEQHNPQNGDGLQHTSHGLLVWRKADNFTAFTDGYRTWVSGPNGLQERLNTQRFSWETNPDSLPPAP